MKNLYNNNNFFFCVALYLYKRFTNDIKEIQLFCIDTAFLIKYENFVENKFQFALFLKIQILMAEIDIEIDKNAKKGHIYFI